MARALMGKELHFESKDETALLGRVTAALAVENVHITHLSAFTAEGKGYFQAVFRDQDIEKAKKAIAYFIENIEERDVLIIEFENKIGTLAPVAKLLGNNRIHIHSCYGTSSDGFKIVGVFSTSDNAQAKALVNADSGSLSA